MQNGKLSHRARCLALELEADGGHRDPDLSPRQVLLDVPYKNIVVRLGNSEATIVLA